MSARCEVTLFLCGMKFSNHIMAKLKQPYQQKSFLTNIKQTLKLSETLKTLYVHWNRKKQEIIIDRTFPNVIFYLVCKFLHIQLDSEITHISALKLSAIKHNTNIAGRLPENSRNRFVDRQSKKTVKETDQKNSSFHWRLICNILI